MKMVYPHCCICEEELWDGEEVYSGMKGYYCSTCLRDLTAEDFLKEEGEMFETAEPIAPQIDIEEIAV